MKEAFWGYLMIILGILAVVLINFAQNVTNSNEQDYYLLREVTEGAMLDAVDIGYYSEYGELKIIKEKFVENFIRRFAQSVNLPKTGYTLKFYDISEVPPKVSVSVSTTTLSLGGGELDIVNYLDAILETKY